MMVAYHDLDTGRRVLRLECSPSVRTEVLPCKRHVRRTVDEVERKVPARR
jgi:hypothetical protein